MMLGMVETYLHLLIFALVNLGALGVVTIFLANFEPRHQMKLRVSVGALCLGCFLAGVNQLVNHGLGVLPIAAFAVAFGVLGVLRQELLRKHPNES